jgi:hypothetical protein
VEWYGLYRYPLGLLGPRCGTALYRRWLHLSEPELHGHRAQLRPVRYRSGVRHAARLHLALKQVRVAREALRHIEAPAPALSAGPSQLFARVRRVAFARGATLRQLRKQS